VPHQGINKGHYVTSKRGFIHTVVIVEYHPMTRRTIVSSLISSFFLTILLICCTSIVSAADADFDISQPNNWSLEYVDGDTMANSGNETASSGDFINLKIPVYNSNTSSADSSWSFSFGFNDQWYGGHSGVLEGNQSLSDVKISFGPVAEGIILCKLEIDNTSESEIIQIRVGPNPVNLTSAGDANLVIIGQPAHVGDELTSSILVHNQGESINSVQLKLTRDDDSTIALGDMVSISPGSSREVSASFTALIHGTQSINWEIISSNGGVDTSLNGSSFLNIQESQDIVVSIDDISWTLSGLELDASISLSSGLNRSADVSVWMKSGNDYSLYQSLTLDLTPGIRSLDFSLGNPDASRLKISVSPNSWYSLNGVAEETIELSAPVISPSILISGVYPESISLGDTVSINYALENNGNARSSTGLLRVVGIADDFIYSERSTPEIDAGDSFSDSIDIMSWANPQTTDVKLIWITGDESISNQTSIIIETGSTTSFSLPFNIIAAIYGALSGLAVVMTTLVLYRVVSQSTPSTETSWNRRKFSESRASRSNVIDEKIEVKCPGCGQRLNVPSSHTGSVKCPACAMLFTNKPQDEANSEDIGKIKPNQPSSNELEASKTLESSSDNDLLSCPQCEQTLKVPLDKRPIRSRCPACRAEFIAKFG
jgi:ribosomal protein S27E